jgi:hypothetical protein
MSLFLKFFAAALLLTTVALSARQGWGMLTDQPPVRELLQPLGLGRLSRLLLGSVVLLGAGLTVFPGTFLWGSYLSAAGILLILALQLHHQNVAGAVVEVPFLGLTLLVLYLRHPLALQ